MDGTSGQRSFAYFASNSTNMKNFLVLACLVIILDSCKKPQQPKFEEIVDFKIEKLGFEQSTISARLRFHNPNTYRVHLKNIDFDLFVDSIMIGHFNNTEEVKIPAADKFILPVIGQASTAMLLKYSKLANTDQKSFVAVKGTAKVGRSGIYKNVIVDYTDSIEVKLPVSNK